MGDRSIPSRENKNAIPSTPLPRGAAVSSCPNIGCPPRPNGNMPPWPMWEPGNTTTIGDVKNTLGKGITSEMDNASAVGTNWQTSNKAKGTMAGLPDDQMTVPI